MDITIFKYFARHLYAYITQGKMCFQTISTILKVGVVNLMKHAKTSK